MGLAWQQGPLAPGAAGRFLVPDPLPGRLLCTEPLRRRMRTTRHQDLGATSWYTVRAGQHSTPRAAWQHAELPGCASELKGRVAFAWRAMDAFYEEDERIVGHAADTYHRIDIRQTVIPHGPDRDLTTDEAAPCRRS